MTPKRTHATKEALWPFLSSPPFFFALAKKLIFDELAKENPKYQIPNCGRIKLLTQSIFCNSYNIGSQAGRGRWVVTHRNKVNIYYTRYSPAEPPTAQREKPMPRYLGVDEPCLKLGLRWMLDFPSKSKVAVEEKLMMNIFFFQSREWGDHQWACWGEIP